MKHFIQTIVCSVCLFLSMGAQAVGMNEAVGMVAMSRQSTFSLINGRDAEVIYVGQFGGCESVSVKTVGDHFQHFRVCAGQVVPRNSVAPLWPDDLSGKRVLSAVVQNAIFYGQASQGDENGYLITARALGSIGVMCKNVEVVISYDGDLVDRGIKRICG